MITDEQVGELWKLVTRKRVWPIPLHAEIKALIRKLVEERAKVFHVMEDTLHYAYEWEGMPDKIGSVRIAAKEKYRKFALRDLRIDPKTWRK